MFGGVLCDKSESHDVWMEFPTSCQTTISAGTRSLASRVPKHSDGNLPTHHFHQVKGVRFPLHCRSFRSSLSCIYKLISKKRLESVLLIDKIFLSNVYSIRLVRSNVKSLSLKHSLLKYWRKFCSSATKCCI